MSSPDIDFQDIELGNESMGRVLKTTCMPAHLPLATVTIIASISTLAEFVGRGHHHMHTFIYISMEPADEATELMTTSVTEEGGEDADEQDGEVDVGKAGHVDVEGGCGRVSDGGVDDEEDEGQMPELLDMDAEEAIVLMNPVIVQYLREYLARAQGHRAA
ncbi:hypothetical protein BDM02DRAFT_3133103 [Thelephora ganbajun]|uniref:Uncharacterized protein n=1 Tax=Thelephora ganbajun TaxID=370292 RepID=A0ACB6YYB9_THEGA|nr:hypothetical protein BDM02DRAFT_3133103 [Thelephora ganbajun]